MGKNVEILGMILAAMVVATMVSVMVALISQKFAAAKISVSGVFVTLMPLGYLSKDHVGLADQITATFLTSLMAAVIGMILWIAADKKIAPIYHLIIIYCVIIMVIWWRF